ncbi:MAG: hypothetical protein ABIL15_04685, partial [candidate division WOR-3 bacterium]
EGMAQLGRYALDRVEGELKTAQKEHYLALLIKTMAKIYAKMDDKEKTTEHRKHLVEIVQKYLKSDYPALKKETQNFIDLIEGKGWLEPEELFLY